MNKVKSTFMFTDGSRVYSKFDKYYKKHKEYAKNRKDLNIKKLTEMSKIFKNHAKKNKIPIFDNIEDAINYLNKKK
jgi:hypothetical protein